MAVVSNRAIASDPTVAAVMGGMLARGNAVDAVVAGVFAAAAVEPSVLLGPVQWLAFALGSGVRAGDGRLRQPGLGAIRPRGFVSGEAIADGAYVAPPALPKALAALLASLGTLSLDQAIAPALECASPLSPPRFELFKRLRRQGPSVLGEGGIAAALLRVGGRFAGGNLTESDLCDPVPELSDAEVRQQGSRRLARIPWRTGENGSRVHVMAAADGRGTMAVACYETANEGVSIDELGLIAPRAAQPVMRGQRRLRPGTPLPVAAPIACTGGELFSAVWGIEKLVDGEEIIERMFERDALSLENRLLTKSDASSVGLAVIRTKDFIESFRFAPSV